MTSVIVLPRAERNLENIEEHIALDNPHRALTFVQELRLHCQDLTAFPRKGSPFPTRKSHIRRLVHGNYLIFYRYRESQDTVFIIRVAEHHQDHSRIVFED